VTIELLYGRGTLAVSPPAGCVPTVIAKPAMPVLADPRAAVERALAEPVGAAPLCELARGKRSACVLICDITRPVPNGLFLGPLIRTLLEAGVPRDGITVLIATGLHRPNDDAELAEVVGDPWVLATVKVENHVATDDADHVLVGRTPGRGTVVRLDRRLVDADLKIATGLVEPHFMAGWSGGRKVIAPGVAHAETITTFHNSTFMAHPCATNCVLDGNPLHEEQLVIVRMLGGALALNTVIDDRRRLAFVNFGEVVESHLRSVAFARDYAQVPVPRRFHTVVTSSAGYPLDKTYYQTVKGMVGPVDILEPGGDLIVASACSEGMGSKHYVEAQRRLVELGTHGFGASIEGKPHADIDEWQTQMQLRPMRVGRVRLYTDGLGEDEGALTGVERVGDLTAAVADSMARHADPHVAFVPEGPYVVPLHAPPRAPGAPAIETPPSEGPGCMRLVSATTPPLT
jgi:nickel-dependent lactate racemase